MTEFTDIIEIAVRRELKPVEFEFSSGGLHCNILGLGVTTKELSVITKINRLRREKEELFEKVAFLEFERALEKQAMVV